MHVALPPRLDALDPPFAPDEVVDLGPEFARELAVTSALWFRCGYRPGVAAYLNFFLLRDFVELHDRVFPPRFATLRAMATSFYATDLFIRAVTDSGREPTGGISSPAVRERLCAIMERHRRLGIPAWMMTYFAWSLFEAVETQCSPAADERRLHLAYMSKAWRLMGIPFATDRTAMTAFARAIEATQAGTAPQLERHARHILCIGETIGVSSAPGSILPMLPAATRARFAPMAASLRPGALRRWWLRLLGALFVPKAVGSVRVAVPVAHVPG
jgi:hypothetical protein